MKLIVFLIALNVVSLAVTVSLYEMQIEFQEEYNNAYQEYSSEYYSCEELREYLQTSESFVPAFKAAVNEILVERGC